MGEVIRMKKSILVFVAVLSLLALAHRPVAAGVNIDFGLKGGLSLTSCQFLNLTEDYHKLNKPFIYGAFLAFNLSKKFAIQLEFYLRTLSAALNQNFQGNFYRTVESYRYMCMPLLAKFRLKNWGKVRPVIFVGFGGAGTVSERMRGYRNGVLEFDDSYVPSGGASVGGVFGGGVEYTQAKLLLILDVRYDAYSSLFESDMIGKYRALTFMAGIGF